MATPDKVEKKTILEREIGPRYEVREHFGQGAYGVVVSAFDTLENRLVAVKKCESITDHKIITKRTLREIMFLRLFRGHDNIINLYRVLPPRSRPIGDLFVVTELMETDLDCIIRSSQVLTEEHCQFFLYQILRGLLYLHSANVIHRDLKPRNLLVNSNCDLKICDFGLARVDFPDHMHKLASMTGYAATRWYRPPEVILGWKKYTKSMDMWAVGCILAELLGRRPLFPGKDEFEQIKLILHVLGTPTAQEIASIPRQKSRILLESMQRRAKLPFSQLFPQAAAEACDFLERALTFDPDKRITVEAALAHPYVKQLHDPLDEPRFAHLDLREWEFEHRHLSQDELLDLIGKEVMSHWGPQCTHSPSSPSAAPPSDACSTNPALLSTIPSLSPINSASACSLSSSDPSSSLSTASSSVFAWPTLISSSAAEGEGLAAHDSNGPAVGCDVLSRRSTCTSSAFPSLSSSIAPVFPSLSLPPPAAALAPSTNTTTSGAPSSSFLANNTLNDLITCNNNNSSLFSFPPPLPPAAASALCMTTLPDCPAASVVSTASASSSCIPLRVPVPLPSGFQKMALEPQQPQQPMMMTQPGGLLGGAQTLTQPLLSDDDREDEEMGFSAFSRVSASSFDNNLSNQNINNNNANLTIPSVTASPAACALAGFPPRLPPAAAACAAGGGVPKSTREELFRVWSYSF